MKARKHKAYVQGGLDERCTRKTVHALLRLMCVYKCEVLVVIALRRVERSHSANSTFEYHAQAGTHT
jgi:hypothetical protein